MADGVSKKPVIHVHADSGLRYLCGTNKVLFSNGVAVDRDSFDTWKDTPGAVKKLLEDHLTHPATCGFDWPYACSTGTLRRKKGSADLVANVRTERRRAKQAARKYRPRSRRKKKRAGTCFLLSFS
jgi:hypothetical protein